MDLTANLRVFSTESPKDQSSVLFYSSLAMCDIEDVIKAWLHIFADDITTWEVGTIGADMRLRMEKTVRELYAFLAFKGLCINLGKCHLMVLGKQYLDINSSVEIDIFYNDVKEENEIVLLGLTIDNKLSFEKHVIELTSKCNNNIRFLWRTAKDRSYHHRFLLTNALVVSHLNYCDTVFHRFLTDKLAKLLSSVQYRALRFICGTRQGQRVSLITLSDCVGWLPLFEHQRV